VLTVPLPMCRHRSCCRNWLRGGGGWSCHAPVGVVVIILLLSCCLWFCWRCCCWPWCFGCECRVALFTLTTVAVGVVKAVELALAGHFRRICLTSTSRNSRNNSWTNSKQNQFLVLERKVQAGQKKAHSSQFLTGRKNVEQSEGRRGTPR